MPVYRRFEERRKITAFLNSTINKKATENQILSSFFVELHVLYYFVDIHIFDIECFDKGSMTAYFHFTIIQVDLS